MLKNTYKKFLNLIIILTLFLGISIVLSVEVYASRDPINNMEFSNGMKLKTLFYPYRDQPSVNGTVKAKHLQGLTVDQDNNFYVSYSTDDHTTYGYIYKYNKKGDLLKKSKKLIMGHAQAMSYMEEYLYVIADIRGEDNYQLKKISAKTLKVEKEWTLPSTIHPNVIAMRDPYTAATISKSGDGYVVNIVHLDDNEEMAMRDYREKVEVDINRLIGKTPHKPIQGFAYGNDQYYLVSDGEYITFNEDGKKVKRVLLNTDREPEGVAIMKDGRLVIGFHKLNEIYIEKKAK